MSRKQPAERRPPRPFQGSLGSARLAPMSPAARARTLRLRTALAFLILAAPACFVFNRANKADARATPAFDVPEGEIALSVTNHNYLDVVIYVLHDGVQTRVGTATGSSSTVFYMPARLLGQGREIRLLGDAIGNDEYARTEILVVQPGQYIEWTLETDLRRSSVGVF